MSLSPAGPDTIKKNCQKIALRSLRIRSSVKFGQILVSIDRNTNTNIHIDNSFSLLAPTSTFAIDSLVLFQYGTTLLHDPSQATLESRSNGIKLIIFLHEVKR